MRRSSEAVTILMPMYNEGEHIDSALESLRAQSHKDLIIMVCDDHSTDDTLERAIAHEERDDRIQVTRPFRENVGACVLLNHMLELAHTDWIARHDGDDISHERRIATQLAFMRDRCDAVLCSVRAETLMTGRGAFESPWERKINEISSNHQPLNGHIKEGPYVMGGTMFGTRAAMHNIKFDADAFPLEDWKMALDLSARGMGEIYALRTAEPLYGRRLSGGNSSANAAAREKAYAYIRNQHGVPAGIDTGIVRRAN